MEEEKNFLTSFRMIYFASKKIPLKHLEKSCQKCKKTFFFFFTFFKIYSQVLVFPPIITYLAYMHAKKYENLQKQNEL